MTSPEEADYRFSVQCYQKLVAMLTGREYFGGTTVQHGVDELSDKEARRALVLAIGSLHAAGHQVSELTGIPYRDFLKNLGKNVARREVDQ